MMKKVLGNQRGMSLLEVTVASAISIVIGLGVMKINENAQKGVTKLKSDTDIISFRDVLKGRLSKAEVCKVATHGGTALAGTDITSDVALADITTGIGAVSEFTTTAGNLTIPSAPDWKVTSAVMKAFDAGTTASLIGECNIEIVVERVKKGQLGMPVKTMVIPMSCRVNAADVIQECAAIINADEEGYWKSTPDGSTGDYLLFSGTTGSPRIKVGTGGAAFPAPLTAAISIDPIGAQVDANAKLHGLALPDNSSITFGNDEDASLYFDTGVGGNTISNSGSFEAVDHIVGNQITGNEVRVNNAHGAIARFTNAYFTDVDVTDIRSDKLWADRIQADRIWVANPVIVTSDERFKKEIETIENATQDILDLRGVTYFLRHEEFPKRGFKETKQYGLIAQELEKIYPELVETTENGFLAVNYSSIVAILIEGFKEQQAQIKLNKEMFEVMHNGLIEQVKDHSKRISKLEQENQSLRSELDELKAQVKILLNKQ